MKKVYIVRHGESEGNIGEHVQSSTSVLSEQGTKQAAAVAERFKNISIDRIISSPYARAAATAHAIADVRGQEVEHSDLLVERKRASAQVGIAKKSPEFHAIEDAVFANYHNTDWHHSDEENFLDLKNRALKLLAHIESLPEERILLVSHGTYLRMIAACVIFGPELTSHESWAFYIGLEHSNTGVTVIQQHQHKDESVRWKLATWNDQAHLEA